MSGKKHSEFKVPDGCPKYRVRLFLAADLSNSTAYKSSRNPKEWVPTFREFYSNFSDLFKRKHLQVIERLATAEKPIDLGVLKECPPQFWKTVGDEIIFVNRVNSCFEVCVLVIAFSEALSEYLNDLKDDEKKHSLGIKGSGWVASFPSPNIAISKPAASDSTDRDLNESEEIESSADDAPDFHEFLGKGLDYGFRIAQNSSDNFLALSPGLANILARPRVNEDYECLSVRLRVNSPVKLKGVLNGKDYPAVGIPIDRDLNWARLRETQERLLSGDQSNDKDIRDYLAHFIKLHEIEEPILKVRPDEDDPSPPSYYTEKYVPDWVASAQEVTDQDEAIKESAIAKDGDNSLEANFLEELLKLIAGTDKKS